VGAKLVAAHRRGKSIWLQTDRGPVLGLHLGMAGRILLDGQHAPADLLFDPDPPTAVLASAASETDGRVSEPPQGGWARFTIQFADGASMVLYDKRRLSRAILDPNLDRLGPDAAEVDREEFRLRIGRGDTTIKARLLDQSAIAGVGNLLADETLWRARLDPRRRTGSLSLEDLDRLRRCLRAATRSAISKGGVHTGHMISARRQNGSCPRCAGPMKRTTIGGRTTWWCPTEQR
jgi:formamidopyrimidine-DNA glycosylase